MITHADLDHTEEVLVRELTGFEMKGRLDSGEEVDALKDVLHCIQMVHQLRDELDKK
ncbi:MAG: hypothetical protein IKO36_11090 [Bacteroidaceae bacterium]|nr:hypothetical protein [Bacteroidaceae bacterium]